MSFTIALCLTLVGLVWLAQASRTTAEPVRYVVVTVGEAPILLAPVIDAPAAGIAYRGERLVSDAEVYGEPIDGSPVWRFVVRDDGAPVLRGFVHSSYIEDEK